MAGGEGKRCEEAGGARGRGQWGNLRGVVAVRDEWGRAKGVREGEGRAGG